MPTQHSPLTKNGPSDRVPGRPDRRNRFPDNRVYESGTIEDDIYGAVIVLIGVRIFVYSGKFKVFNMGLMATICQALG